MKIVVTGSQGFIGTHLCKRLVDSGHDVVGIDIQDGRDISSYKFDQSNSVDAVVHLAAKVSVHESISDPQPYWQTNVVGSKKVFEWADAIGCRLIIASTSNAKWWYLNPYAASKAAMEAIAPKHSAILRLHNVYGNNIRSNLLLDKIKKGAVTHKTDHFRDMIRVEEVCDIIERLLQPGFDNIAGIIDVGTGIPQSIKQLIEMCDIDVPLVTDTPNEVHTTQANIERLIQELNYYPKSNILKDLPELLKD